MFRHVRPPVWPAGRRPFLLVSEMNGKVLDIMGCNAGPGATLCAFYRKMEYSPNQLWYIDQTGCIRSMLNDYSIECRAQGDSAHMQPWRGDPRQQWVVQGNRVVNRMYPHECLDIARMEQRDGAQVIAWMYKGSVNQHWRMEYV